MQGRAVITTTDAGGPTELVTDGVQGLVVEPAADALAAAIDARSSTIAPRLRRWVTALATRWTGSGGIAWWRACWSAGGPDRRRQRGSSR